MHPKFDFEAVQSRLSRWSDVALALAIVTVIALLVFRIDQHALDFFLAVNLAVSFVVLLAAVYASDATKLPAFPTLLLLTTLFRLALNVSSTRLILLDADAGAIIRAFGEFVVGGDFIVGGVIFLVLTIVQFLVIAKGSERVAEVAARFTLDAMPGKQMSIDADLRSQLISQDDARRRRHQLERESKLYGAMDGAMKFVKGDAIAGIVISLVNIVGGLVIGVLSRGMDAGEAARTYTLLTVGDGLVSQIPALLVSVAAGIVVTRVAAGEQGEESLLGREMFDQVLGNPKALGIVCGLLALLAFVPGFPTLTLLVIAVALGGLAWMRQRTQRKPPEKAQAGSATPHARPPEVAPAPPPYYAPAPLQIEIHSSLKGLFAPTDPLTRRRIHSDLGARLARVSRELGVRLPEGNVVISDTKLAEGEYAFLAHGAPFARGRVEAGRVLVFASAEELRAAGVDAVPGEYAASRVPAAWVQESDAERAAAGRRIWRPTEVVLEHFERELARQAHSFVGIQETYELVEAHKEKRSHLVQSVIPTLISWQQLTEVLQLLLQEQVPIRDLRQVLETLARHAATEKSTPRLVELVRRDLRRAICDRHARGHRRLEVYRLDQELEARLLEHLGRKPLSPRDRREIVASFESAVDALRHLSAAPVVCVRFAELRAFVRRLIEDRLPDAVVLSDGEIPHDFTLAEVDSIGGRAPSPA